VRNNPITSADFANRKMAIFDIDNTILDPEQRFIDARRAGVIDKDGAPKGKRGWKDRGDFLYTEDRLLKDRVMDNSMDLIEHLMEKGYVIAYCTARPFAHYEATKYQLEQKGFPLFQNGAGEDLLFCKRSLGQKTPLYKKGVVETLQAQYDVRLFFDDQRANAVAALQADVPGVYASVQEYYGMIKGVRGNPYTVEDPDPHGFYAPKPYDQDTADAEERNPRGSRRNPVKRGSDSKGSYYRWGKNQKYYYKTGSKTSRENARKKAHKQAKAAFAGGYQGKYNPGEEYSSDYMVPRDVDTLGKAADRIEETYYDGLEVPEWWKSKMSVTADKADSLADAISYVADNPRKANSFCNHCEKYVDLFGRCGCSTVAAGMRNPPNKILKIYSGEPKSKFKNMGVVFAEVQIGRNIAKDVGEVVQSVYRGLIGGRTSMAERRMAMAIASMQKELSDRATDAGGNAIANLKVDYEIVQGTATLTIIAHADAIKMARKPKSNPPRSNPPKSKVEKGKELYKHMNGKNPEKTEIQKIDIGDVWYQVGEGGCWEIGYMSGKETGSANQKYRHTFNEETKNGDFPKLYATIPDKGKPMLIITGGTWKIKTDEDGVAWIYD
jgi:uncharacterized protein YbjQ (UPF0145 family)